MWQRKGEILWEQAKGAKLPRPRALKAWPSLCGSKGLSRNLCQEVLEACRGEAVLRESDPAPRTLTMCSVSMQLRRQEGH